MVPDFCDSVVVVDKTSRGERRTHVASSQCLVGLTPEVGGDARLNHGLATRGHGAGALAQLELRLHGSELAAGDVDLDLRGGTRR